jgi:hypothetical protein
MSPPPVENPEIVPDFAQAWAYAYKKAKAKVGILISLSKAFSLAVPYRTMLRAH